MEVNGLKTAKLVVRALGLRSIAGWGARVYARAFPHQICRRDGIWYELDLDNTIDLGIWLGGWEPETLGFIRQHVKLGDVVLEVGANIGAHTLVIGDLVGPSGVVHAFEPTDVALSKLRASLARNPQMTTRVNLWRNLVTDHSKSMPLLDIKSIWPVNHKERPPEHITAAPIALDVFMERQNLTRINLLKIDVDGYDLKVLQGAMGLLATLRPLVLVELCEYALNRQGDSVTGIFDLMHSLGYRGYREDGTPLPTARNALAIVGTETSINGVFRPHGN